jgi:hypothetical protein
LTKETESKTNYWRFKGHISWAKVYDPDTFRGSTNWLLNFYPLDEAEWENFKKSGIQGKPKEDDGEKSGIKGKFVTLKRPVMKAIKGNPVYFTPPRIYDEEGNRMVTYVDGDGKEIRSYEDKTTVVNRVGDQVLIGNGTLAYVNVVVYPTGMGPGNRLESIQILDLVKYEKADGPEIQGHNDEELPF